MFRKGKQVKTSYVWIVEVWGLKLLVLKETPMTTVGKPCVLQLTWWWPFNWPVIFLLLLLGGRNRHEIIR